jgi:hypothetical protein
VKKLRSVVGLPLRTSCDGSPLNDPVAIKIERAYARIRRTDKEIAVSLSVKLSGPILQATSINDAVLTTDSRFAILDRMNEHHDATYCMGITPTHCDQRGS